MITGKQTPIRLVGLAFSFATVLIILCCEFELFATGDSIINCIVHPSLIITTYFEKIAIAFFFSSFVLIVKRKWWIIVVTVLIILWIIAELVYLQFFGSMLIDGYSIKMVGNMSGFWDSILPFLHLKYLLLLCPLGLIVICVIFLKTSETKLRYFFYFLAFSLFLHFSYSLYVCAPFKKDNITKLPIKVALTPICSDFYDTADLRFSSNYSVIHCFVRSMVELFKNGYTPVNVYQLSDELKSKGIVGPGGDVIPNSKLIIILTESLESWAILPHIMPNVSNFMTRDNIIWVPKVQKQTMRGQSSDGQMIVNTGLLPVRHGAACYRFPANSYPSISELFSSTFAFVPGGLNVWNQGMMCRAYGIRHPIETGTDDKEIVELFMENKDLFDYALIMTASTHSPFSAYADKSSIDLPDDMPKVMSDYLKSVNYLDSCLGIILSKIDVDCTLKGSTIVITSDHSIFAEEQRSVMSDYCNRSGHGEYKVDDDFCPLLIYSPNIGQRKELSDSVYQMDIYPTILNIIGCGMFYWKGFGVDLSNCSDRIITQESAYVLSEQIFYSNYFSLPFLQ